MNAALLFPSRQRPARLGPSLWYALPIGLAIGMVGLALILAVFTGLSWVLRSLAALAYPHAADVHVGTVGGMIATVFMLAVAVLAPSKRGRLRGGLSPGQRAMFVVVGLSCLINVINDLLKLG